MRATRRARAIALTAALLFGLGALFDRPSLVVGGAVVGAFLLARLLLFVARFRRTVHATAVEVSVPDRRVPENDDSLVTLRAHLTEQTSLDLTVTAETPVSASGPPAPERRVHIGPGRHRAEMTFTVQWSVVGTVAFDPPTVDVADRVGLFRERVRLGSTPEMIVEPRRPARLHVGEGGDRIGLGFGEHRSSGLGSGIEPAELRQYTPGDDASDIDWNATARLDEAYVREHEAETDRRTVLLVDHRARLGDGPPGGTQLDYLRAVGMTFVDRARDLGDPLALYAVGEDGVTTALDPATDAEQYLTVETALAELAPTGGPDTGAEAGTADGASEEDREPLTPGAARTTAAALSGDASTFGRTLRPYFRHTRGYVRRVADDPLYAAAERDLRQVSEGAWVLLFTDDADRARLEESVRRVRAGGADRVTVFLAPDVLFDPEGLADLERAYERYVDFESFRRDLSRLDGVTAYEVGPGDRIDAVLSLASRSA